ncbi:hypothetical protein JOM56_009931 [Amanita muscaria]
MREGRKPLEAVPGMKADANAIPEWGSKSLSVTARLDSRVNKGRWAGVDEKSEILKLRQLLEMRGSEYKFSATWLADMHDCCEQRISEGRRNRYSALACTEGLLSPVITAESDEKAATVANTLLKSPNVESHSDVPFIDFDALSVVSKAKYELEVETSQKIVKEDVSEGKLTLGEEEPVKKKIC